jgi:hypothetical protein
MEGMVPPEWRGFAVAAGLALLLAGAGRLLGRPRLAAAAAGIGLAAGFVAVFGVVNASPRQLAERLPALAILALPAGVVAAVPGRGFRPAGLAAGALLGAWWMAGAPLVRADLLRAAPEALALLVAMAAAIWRGAAAPGMAVAWAVLAAGLVAAGARGPQPAFALAGMGAVLGAALLRAGLGPPGRVPLSVALVGVAAVPLLARAAAADIAAAAAPFLALLAGPAAARRLGRWLGLGLAAWLGPALAALPAVAAAWALARGWP